MKKAICFLAFVLLVSGSLFAITAEEIINKMEDNQVHQTTRMTGSMTITDKFGTKKSTFISYARGEEESLIEFTSLEEAGQKILRLKNEIYLFFPDAEELIRIQGSALKDGVLGSDMSYEDMTGGKGLLASYKVVLEGTEEVDGNECYKITLTGKFARKVVYPKQTMWVDTKLFAYRKVHQFSKSGKLLKEMRITDFKEMKGKTIPTYFVLEDKLKRNSKTEFVIEDLEIDLDLDPKLFSLEELTW